jgi:pimeloyl-ACP methyl ester carboxylesterase
MNTTTHLVDDVPVTVLESGEGHPVLLLHGGGGPNTVVPWGERVAASRPAHVFVPIHAGFNGTARPDRITTVRDLATLYLDLLEVLNLNDVTVIGNSIGGWIAAEMAAAASPRVGRAVIVDGVGLHVAGHPYADFFSLTPAQLSQRTFADPVKFGIDPSTLPPAAREAMAANREPIALYGGSNMADETLEARLAKITAPTIVIWGESDRIGDPEIGKAYVAAIPNARFELMQGAGHLPQIEKPEELTDLVWEFADAHAPFGSIPAADEI